MVCISEMSSEVFSFFSTN